MIGNKRRRLFIDAKLQGLLCLRVFFYWVFCVISLCLVGLAWRIFTDPSSLFQSDSETLLDQVPVIVGALLLVPVLLYDSLVISNKFAGPIYRLRRSLHDLGDGRTVVPIHFRQGDFWCDLAVEFNRVAARVEQLEIRLAEFEGVEQPASTFDEPWQSPAEVASSP